MKLILILNALLLVNFCFAQNDSTRKWTTINRSLYTIDFPSDMILDTTMEMGSDLFMNTYQDNLADSFSENVVILIDNLNEQDEGITAEIYTKKQEDLLYEMYPDLIIDESAILKNTNGEYHKWVYSAKGERKRLKWEQYTYIAHKKAFIITLTTTDETFEKYKVIGETILNSFKLKP